MDKLTELKAKVFDADVMVQHWMRVKNELLQEIQEESSRLASQKAEPKELASRSYRAKK